jgi:hypothetical protein
LYRQKDHIAREKQFDAALVVIGTEFEKYSEMEPKLKVELDAVIGVKSRAESEQNLWHRKKSKPHDRVESEREYQEFEDLRLECERRMEAVVARLKSAVKEVRDASFLPLNFESCLKCASQTRAKRDWRIANQEKENEIRGKTEQLEAQARRVWEDIKELKHQYPILVGKSESQQPVDEEIDEKYHEFHDAYLCQNCFRSGYRRPRDTVLAKCGHSYCRDCIDQLVKLRNRKCPVCSQAFDPTATKSTNGVIEIKWLK